MAGPLPFFKINSSLAPWGYPSERENLATTVTGGCLKKMTVGCPVFGRLPRDLSISGRSFAKMLRMADTAASEAARRLVAQRWRGQRPVRLARELAERVGELPTEERSRLLDALRDGERAA